MEKFDRDILLRIRETTAPFLHRTPLWRSKRLSALTEHDVFLKCELFQKTGSYKPRGMLWALRSLSEQERDKGVITFSALTSRSRSRVSMKSSSFTGRLLPIL